MKVGILTFHCAYNYGAILQCYALQQWLAGHGADTVVIDYRPHYLETPCPRIRSSYFKPTTPLRSFKRLFRMYPAMKRQYVAFRDFEDRYLTLSETFRTKEDMEQGLSGLDRVVIGSDQIWNTDFNGNDTVWYADFKHAPSTRVITYAASAGDPKTSGHMVLDRFHRVSVREQALAVMPEVALSSPVTVCDPVLLASPDIWKQWESPVVSNPYILVYQGRRDDSLMSLAKELSARYGAEIISVDCYLNSFSKGIRHLEPGPDGFVSLVKNALCVLTTSFHGAAMSIALKTPFYVIRLNDGADLRASELLGRMGLSDRMLGRGEIPDTIDVDFTTCVSLLEKERKISGDYLIGSLGL